MTATSRHYTDEAHKKAEESDVVLCSMDDVSLYGDEIYGSVRKPSCNKQTYRNTQFIASYK